MIYRIVVCSGNGPGIDIYGPDAEMAVLNPHLEIELNSAGSLEFTLPVENINWNVPNVFQNEIEVWEDDKIIWFGRPLQIVRDWNNQRRVVCEGALSYFNDTIQRTWEQQPENNKTNITFFKHLLSVHNNDTDNNKHFTEGEITIESVPAYRKTDYETTLDCLQNMCLSTDGGYFILRKEYTWDASSQSDVATRYIDWYENLPENSAQDVQFGYNLLDITQDLNGADICTVVIAFGKDDVMLNTLGNKNEDDVVHISGSDEIYYQPGVELYGRVIQQKSWNDYGDVPALWRKAKEWLIDKNTDIPTIECSAADLYYISDPGMIVEGPLQVGMNVQVVSGPHDFNKTLMMYKISMDLDSGIKKVTLGTPPKKELTDIVAPSSGGNSTSGNGGKDASSGGSSSSGSTVIAPVQDVRMKLPGESNFSSTVKKKTAKLDLSSLVADVRVDGTSIKGSNGVVNLDPDDFGKVDDVRVDGTSVVTNKIAEIEIPVKDVLSNGESIVDEHGNANIDDIVKVNNRQGFIINELGEIEYGHEFIRDLYLNRHAMHYHTSNPDNYAIMSNINFKSGRNTRIRVGNNYYERDASDIYTLNSTDVYVDASSPSEPDIYQVLYDISAHEPFYDNEHGSVADKIEYIVDSSGVYGIQMLATKAITGRVWTYVTIETSRYNEVSPVGTEDPSAEGWYEVIHALGGDRYALTEDQTVDPNQTYYSLSPNHIFYRENYDDNNNLLTYFSLIKLYTGDKITFVWYHDEDYGDKYILRSIFRLNNVNTTTYSVLSEDPTLLYPGRSYSPSISYGNNLILAVESFISILADSPTSTYGFGISNSYIADGELIEPFISYGIHDNEESEKLSQRYDNAIMYGIDNNPGTYTYVQITQWLNHSYGSQPTNFLGARFVLAFPPYETGGGGGTDVEPNPVGSPTANLNTVRIENTVYNIPGDVHANPTEAAARELESIKIAGVSYDIPTNNDESSEKFECVNDIQIFTAPKTGDYKLEVWGAQGGAGSNDVHGGYGGYSVGEVTLTQGDVLYICVGGKGGGTVTGDDTVAGYNGGGLGNYGGNRGNGGGATHIALVTGTLNRLQNNLSDILIVAGGGGGAGYYGGEEGTGGSGGGYIGGHGLFNGSTTGGGSSNYTGSGGTQSAGGGTDDYSGTQDPGLFGHGASRHDGDDWGGSGGGGGLYGGGASTNNAGAGGGSGYIGNSALHNKCMYGYGVTESASVSTKTVSINVHSLEPKKKTSKEGDGYAIISWKNNKLPKHAYSTDEKPAGTWIDDSVIYEKTFDVGSDISIGQSWTTINSITISDANRVISVLGQNDQYGVSYPLAGGMDSTHLKVCNTVNANLGIRYFIVQYTKST